MWLCYFKDGEIIVDSLKGSQKGSQKSACKVIDCIGWREAKAHGIRCYRVEIVKVKDKVKTESV